MISFSSASHFPVRVPSNIAGAAAFINIAYLAIIGSQSSYYKRKPLLGQICWCFSEGAWVVLFFIIYCAALAVLSSDIWLKFGYDTGISFVGIILSWIPGRILCPFYTTSSAEVYKNSDKYLNPRSYVMLALRVVGALCEITAICWICLSLYLFSGSYRTKTDIYNAIRMTSIVLAALFCVGCNIWWALSAILPTNSGSEPLQESLLPRAQTSSKMNSNDVTLDADSNHTPLPESKVSYSLLFSWFTPVLAAGARRLLHLSDLPRLPQTLQCCYNAARLQVESLKSFLYINEHSNNHTVDDGDYLIDNWIAETDEKAPKLGYLTLIKLLWNVYGMEFLSLGIFKLLICLSSFAGPLLLGAMVSYIEDSVGTDNLLYGLYLVAALGFSFLVSAALNTASNIRGTILQMKVKGALTKLVFARAMNLPLYAWTDMALTDAKLITLIQVDVERVSDSLKSLHDLWALPIQLIVAFVLLYDEVV